MDQELEKLLGIEPDSGALVYFHTPSNQRLTGMGPDYKTLRRLTREARATATDTRQNVVLAGPPNSVSDLLADVIVADTGTVIKNRRGQDGIFVGDALMWGVSSSA